MPQDPAQGGRLAHRPIDHRCCRCNVGAHERSFCAGLSVATGDHRGAVRRRRIGRHRRPVGGAEAHGAAGQTLHRREPPGRRHRDRDDRRREVRSLRPHAAVRAERHVCDQPDALQATCLRSAQGPDNGRAGDARSAGAGGQSVAASELGSRSCEIRQGQSGQGFVRGDRSGKSLRRCSANC